MSKKLKMGMVGGGPGAFIGEVHRIAARLDGQIELVCGAFSSDPKKSQKAGRKLFVDPKRTYGSFEEMIKTEKTLSVRERMDFVSIVTPNHMHFAPAKMALQNGFHVICDKPVCLTSTEAKQLKKVVDKSGLVFALTHNYTGYPMVKEARDIVASGKLGKVRKVVVSYLQGWLSTNIEKSGQKQASWRTDPKRSGIAGAMGDIGSHAENLAEYITGLEINRICADINTFVKGRRLDDDGAVFIEYKGGAKGVLLASQIAAGEENDLTIKVYGEKGGLEWQQMEPNSLVVKWLYGPPYVRRTGRGNQPKSAVKAIRLPAGHPEGYLEAFGNIYTEFARAVRDHKSGKKGNYDFPTIEDGIRGMRFIEKVIESGKSREKWIRF